MPELRAAFRVTSYYRPSRRLTQSAFRRIRPGIGQVESFNYGGRSGGRVNLNAWQACSFPCFRPSLCPSPYLPPHTQGFPSANHRYFLGACPLPPFAGFLPYLISCSESPRFGFFLLCRVYFSSRYDFATPPEVLEVEVTQCPPSFNPRYHPPRRTSKSMAVYQISQQTSSW